jgi:hypothetical protein
MSGLRKYAKLNRNFDTFFETIHAFTHTINPKKTSYYMDLRGLKMSDCGNAFYVS